MIKRLRKRFIIIATAAVTAVMLVLCLIVISANYASVNSELKQMLDVIINNEGHIPSPNDTEHEAPPEKPTGDMNAQVDTDAKGEKSGIIPFIGISERHDGQFTPETPFSTRYFMIKYNSAGELTDSQFDMIAAVTEADAAEYIDIAMKHGEGYGYISGYKYCVKSTGDDEYTAVFLDCYRDMRNLKITAVLSFAAVIACVAVVYVIIVLCSRRAIDPVVKAAEKQKQFITDAGHELKTPITVIATSLKVLEMETGKQKWIDKAQAQTEKLTELVNSLVALAKTDEGGVFNFARFDISETLSETVGSFSDYAETEGHILRANIPPDIIYNGDEYAVRQLVSVLIDNAVKYASEGSPIEFSLAKEKKGVSIRCKNECGEIDTSKLDKLFDRFYRADESRSSSGGFGIGLSLAKSIAEGHRGSIKAASPDGRTIIFTAELK